MLAQAADDERSPLTVSLHAVLGCGSMPGLWRSHARGFRNGERRDLVLIVNDKPNSQNAGWESTRCLGTIKILALYPTDKTDIALSEEL